MRDHNYLQKTDKSFDKCPDTIESSLKYPLDKVFHFQYKQTVIDYIQRDY